jgi:hypothetical protein
MTAIHYRDNVLDIVQVIFLSAKKSELVYRLCYKLHDPRNQGFIPGKSMRFLFSIESIPSVGPTQLPMEWVLLLFLTCGTKRLGHEADHSSSKIKNSPSIYYQTIVLNYLRMGVNIPIKKAIPLIGLGGL